MENYHPDVTLSLEEIEVEKILQEANEKIKEIEETINRIPKERSLSLHNNPPGFKSAQVYGASTFEKEKLKAEIVRSRNIAEGKVDKIFDKCPLDIQRKIEKMLEKWKEPDKYKERNIQERKNEEKSLQASQSLAVDMLLDEREGKDNQAVNGSKNMNPEPTKLSMSAKFFTDLKYNDYLLESDPSPEIDIDKE